VARWVERAASADHGQVVTVRSGVVTGEEHDIVAALAELAASDERELGVLQDVPGLQRHVAQLKEL
jgi:hypothetical protein